MASLRSYLPPAGSTVWRNERLTRTSSSSDAESGLSTTRIKHIVIREVWKRELPSPHAVSLLLLNRALNAGCFIPVSTIYSIDMYIFVHFPINLFLLLLNWLHFNFLNCLRGMVEMLNIQLSEVGSNSLLQCRLLCRLYILLKRVLFLQYANFFRYLF